MYFVVAPFSQEFALTAFIIGLAPTATAAPAVTSFLKDNIEYVTASVVLTNVAIALALPFFMLVVAKAGTDIATLGILRNIFIVIFVPFVLAQAIRLYLPALVICIVNFGVGRLIGGKRFGLEASQSLGQKNTMFMLWFSLSFLNPLVALGPVMYLVYHNTYNSYQLYRKERALQAGDMRNNS